MTDEHSSPELAQLASRALRDPGSITQNEIRSLAACVLTQAKDKAKPRYSLVDLVGQMNDQSLNRPFQPTDTPNAADNLPRVTTVMGDLVHTSFLLDMTTEAPIEAPSTQKPSLWTRFRALLG